jgi:hypothetical protein
MALTGMTLSLTEFQPKNLTTTLEQAVYIAHSNKESNSSATILILPNCKYTPYLANNLHTSYVKKVATFPYSHTSQGTHPSKYNLDVYIIANSKALTLLDVDNIQTTLNEAPTQAYDQRLRTTQIDNTKPDANDIDCNTSYKDTPILVHLHTTTSILQIDPRNRNRNPRDFVYKDGSLVKGTPH